MTSLISIYTGGILTIFMAIFHTRFYRLFRWKEEYEKLSEVNRKIFYTIHIFLLLIFMVMGILTLIYAQELSQCLGISMGFNLSISLFWLTRTVWQIIYFKGKAMHFILIIYFFLLFVSYLIPVLIKIV
jgi:hypothetical protein